MLKWSAATLRAMPAHWRTGQVVIDNPIRPSAAQIRAAAGEPVEVLPYAAVIAGPNRATGRRPAGLHRSGRRVVAADRVFRRPTRPVLIAGLPGISIPASSRAVRARAGCDLFLLHSHEEIAEFTGLAARHGPKLIFGLASLPFLSRHRSAR